MEYHTCLEGAESEVVIPYTEGLIGFYKQNYSLAETQFNRVLECRPQDVFWGFEARVMLWRSWFMQLDQLQLEQVDEMERHYDAYRMALSRNNHLSEYQKTCYRNFGKYFARLIHTLLQIQQDQQQKALAELYDTCQKTAQITNKPWLIAAIEKHLQR